MLGEIEKGSLQPCCAGTMERHATWGLIQPGFRREVDMGFGKELMEISHLLSFQKVS